MAASILHEQHTGIVTVTLNRPDRMNALDRAAWALLADTMQQIDADDGVRCVVLRGAGGRAFAAGADIQSFEAERGTKALAREYGEVEMAGVSAVANCRHPTVALIEGACVGGGLEIAAGCDVRVCGTSSRFGVPINRLGLTMAYDELAFFVRAVGRAAAMEILLEGSVFDAERALHLGLVQRVVPDEDVEAAAYATAQRIADGAPLVNRWHKKFLRRLDDPAPLTPDEIDEGFAAFDTEDFQIGYKAFLAKQRPKFEGR